MNEYLEATEIVAHALGHNKLGVTPDQLQVKPNPKGKGEIVYVERTRYFGVERLVLWMVIDGRAFPMNGATKNITPDLDWPREAEPGLWEQTNLDPYQTDKDILQALFSDAPAAE